MNWIQLRDELNKLSKEQLKSEVRVQVEDTHAVYDEDRFQFNEGFIFDAGTSEPYLF
jgi:hypothetical protein